jgi:tRNA nucleotidyltransferase (CCA-adding enzyme)
MSDVINLASEIRKHLPVELVDFMRVAGEAAVRERQGIYLVGGTVRDLLLGRGNLDIDLVADDDAISLTRKLVKTVHGEITTHSRFNTAKLKWNQWSVDLATVRSETYERPGALPTVKPGSLASDLFRRDFTINAMAIELTSSHYGQLIDLYGGQDDLEHKLVRILHEESFIDDATRIWRAIRYEQRLGFHIEARTLRLLKRNVPMLDTISGDRIRHELELVLKEELLEKALCRADELGVLNRLHPSLKGDGWLAKKFKVARKLSRPDSPPVGLCLALLAYRLTAEETEKLIAYLRLPKTIDQTVRDTVSLKEKNNSLSDPKLPPSKIYSILHGYSPIALTAHSIATDSAIVREHIQTFLTKLRYIKPSLTGDDLIEMGVPPGPKIKELLHHLREARLDGKVRSKREEAELVWGRGN